jgi:hypothetical protein
MTDTTGRDLRNYCEEAESTQDEPLSANATRPGRQRTQVLSVRLNAEEFDELTHYAAYRKYRPRRSYEGGFSTSFGPGRSRRSGPLSGSPTSSSSYAGSWWHDGKPTALARS